MPQELKIAHITPLLKKVNLIIEILKNYRPVSGLPFVSKIIEKHVDGRMTKHDRIHNLSEKFQSAYTECCSTETALLRVHNDLLISLDTKGAALLVLLDLSAAFDTIDHGILLERLEYAFGLTDSALSWMKSYLSERQQAVVINGTVSEPKDLKYGFPQGSVLGPRNWKRYSAPIGVIARKHELCVHLYADDTQLYITFSPTDPADIETAITKIEGCITDVKGWMLANFLKLNDDKTEILVLSKKNLEQVPSVRIGSADIKASTTAKNLGVIFDKTLSMESQINAVCKRAFWEIRNIGRIRPYLNDKSAASLVHSFVSSRLDYCNSLYYGVSKKHQNKLQRVLNCAARVVAKVKKSEHITPTLAHLHWLPIQQRIEYKVLLLTFKALHGLAPEYLAELICQYQPAMNLRSEDQELLCVPPTNLVTYGDRAFVKAAPTLWNRLPIHVRKLKDVNCFKQVLKTHLYRIAFN